MRDAPTLGIHTHLIITCMLFKEQQISYQDTLLSSQQMLKLKGEGLVQRSPLHCVTTVIHSLLLFNYRNSEGDLYHLRKGCLHKEPHVCFIALANNSFPVVAFSSLCVSTSRIKEPLCTYVCLCVCQITTALHGCKSVWNIMLKRPF